VRNEIDPAALSGAIDEVIRAMPETARPEVQQHIDEVLRMGQALASQMSPEQRASVASAPAPETVDPAERALIRRWGWDGYRGWGGDGAFAFPSTYEDQALSDDSGAPPKCVGLDAACALAPPGVCLTLPRCHLEQ
jgi:hypothetical protein